jgi:hypothetical protein
MLILRKYGLELKFTKDEIILIQMLSLLYIITLLMMLTGLNFSDVVTFFLIFTAFYYVFFLSPVSRVRQIQIFEFKGFITFFAVYTIILINIIFWFVLSFREKLPNWLQLSTISFVLLIWSVHWIDFYKSWKKGVF